VKLRIGSPEEAGLLPERIELARTRCAEWVKNGETPTLCVCVARRGVIALHEAWGVQTPGGPPLQLDSVFPVASVTKPVTATLVLQLVEDGLLGLNRPVRDYLPELSGEGSDEILVHHLLTHTSGYPWHTDVPMMLHAAKKLEAGWEPPDRPEHRHWVDHELLELFWDAPRIAGVGELMIYSNHNYTLLGELVRRLHGQDLESVAREHLFGPLGMDDSWYTVPESESGRVVQRPPEYPFGSPMSRHMQGLGSRQGQERDDGGGGVFSTPLDMTTFGQMILSRGRYGDARILSPATVAAMTRDQIPGVRAKLFDLSLEHASWGYGWAIESPSKWPYFHGTLQPLGALVHPGAGGAMFWVDPASELTAAYFEVTKELTPRFEHKWGFDLFQNLITSAVVD
jgi:CubicO group peptidase (beta-lactamase class C family)